MRSPRDSETIYNAWKRENEIVKGYNQVIQIVNQMTREIKRLEGRRTQDFDLFPFKLYNLPDEFQVNSFSPDNWHTINVRGGYVFVNQINTGSTFVNGTDRMESVAYQNILSSPPYTAGQYVVPTGSNQYWFWVETSGSTISGSPYFLRASSTPQTSDAYYNPNGWTSWPSASEGEYIIGYVDTVSQAASNFSVIRQFQHSDILSAGNNISQSVKVNICNTATGNIDIYTLYGYLSASVNVTASI